MKTWAQLTDPERIQRTASAQGYLFLLAFVALIVAIIALVFALTA